MSAKRLFAAVLVLLASQGLAQTTPGKTVQNPCQVKLGVGAVYVPLRNAPNAFEPSCAPERIRVNDRTPVTIIIQNVSPVETCAVSSKPPNVTTVTNPLESIINTVAGLKSFDIETASNYNVKVQNDIVELEKKRTPPNTPPKPKTPEEQALEQFQKLASSAIPQAQGVQNKQINWQNTYKGDLDTISAYLAADYRGDKWRYFDPDNDKQITDIQKTTSFISISTDLSSSENPPSEVDYAGLQAIVDQMKAVQANLLVLCGKTGASCDSGAIQNTYQQLDQFNAILAVLQDNYHALQTTQATIASSIAMLHKIKVDFQLRQKAGTVVPSGKVLIQPISLPADYGATDTGTITCSSDTTPAVATTDAINYSVLYQNVPAFTVSTGLLTTFLEKREIGTTTKLNPDGTYGTYFAVTDSARASVFPMAYINYRTGPPSLRRWWGQPESELVLTNSVSAGIGVNPNTGTNQVEFFLGDAIGFSRAYLHFGVHFGRTESIGGGYQLDTLVPKGFTGQPPIDWSYHPAFAIGLSVRIAPW